MQPRDTDGDTFRGSSIHDLEAERARMEYAVDHPDDPDAVPRMRERLDVIRQEILALGYVG